MNVYFLRNVSYGNVSCGNFYLTVEVIQLFCWYICACWRQIKCDCPDESFRIVLLTNGRIPGGVRVAEVRHLEDHLFHVVRVGADLELAHLKEVR